MMKAFFLLMVCFFIATNAEFDDCFHDVFNPNPSTLVVNFLFFWFLF